MAKGKTDGGNGGGKKDEMHLNADRQNEIRRTKKAAQRANRGRGKQLMTTNILEEVRSDRVAARAARERSNREHVARGAVRCLARESEFRKWSELEVLFGIDYIEALAGLVDERHALDGVGLSDAQRRAAQRFFAGAIVRAKYPPKGTPGQLADWFEPAYAKAQASFDRQRTSKAPQAELVSA